MDNGEPFTARPAPGEQAVGGVTAATREPRGPQRPAGSGWPAHAPRPGCWSCGGCRSLRALLAIFKF